MSIVSISLFYIFCLPEVVGPQSYFQRSGTDKSDSSEIAHLRDVRRCCRHKHTIFSSSKFQIAKDQNVLWIRRSKFIGVCVCVCVLFYRNILLHIIAMSLFLKGVFCQIGFSINLCLENDSKQAQIHESASRQKYLECRLVLPNLTFALCFYIWDVI